MGSHHVHGTWTSLYSHYLVKENDMYGPRGNDVVPSINQFAFTALMMVKVQKSYVSYLFDERGREVFEPIYSGAEEEILSVFTKLAEADFTKSET